MTLGRVAVAVAALVAVCAVVAVGRWEKSRALERERADIDAAYTVVGREIATRYLSGYRVAELDCLFYAVDKKRHAMTLCFDHQGRLVESTDRRGPEPKYSSVRLHPEFAPVTVDAARLARLLQQIGAEPRG